MVLTASVLAAALTLAQTTAFDPHGDSNTGVERVRTEPRTRGDCQQCHPQHNATGESERKILFTRNDNSLCFSLTGTSPCHQSRPSNYPLREEDRIPIGEVDAGYPEYNNGGIRRPGVNLRGRWPGEQIWADARLLPGGHHVSPHAHDADMPRQGTGGEGLCLNCHDPHARPGRDLLVDAYSSISGHAESGPPAAYRLCFRCHGRDGVGSMEPESRSIEDYYDSGLNGTSAGHQIRRNPAIALSWPPHVKVGDKLPCYDCHNPHGSAGNDLVRPNGALLSDQRRDWSSLDNTRADARQARLFCLGCHIPSDGIPGSRDVEGIVMNTLSQVIQHASNETQSCYDCHGMDYTSATSSNVHNPARGDAGTGSGSFWGSEGTRKPW